MRRSKRATAALALELVLASSCGWGGEPDAVLWLADPGQDALLALDAELCVDASIAVEAPRGLVATPGGLWVSCVSGAGDEGRLVRIGREGVLGRSFSFGPIRAVCALGDEAVLIEDLPDGDGRLWRVDERDGPHLLLDLPGARALASDGLRILAGCAGGVTVLLTDDGAVLDWTTLRGSVLGLGSGPSAEEHSWWALHGDEETFLALLGERLQLRWETSNGSGNACFAAVADEERAWVSGPRGVRRLGPAGSIELVCGDLPCSGELRLGPVSRSRALLFSPGALLELETTAKQVRLRRTQGGFSALAGAAALAR